MTFDLKSIFFTHTIINSLVLLVAFFIWVKNRKRFPGTFFWLLGLIAAAFGELFFIFRGIFTPWIPVLFGNGLLILGFLFLYRGLTLFSGTRFLRNINILVYVFFLAGIGYFTVIVPHLQIRITLFSVMTMFLCLECFWSLYSVNQKRFRNTYRWVSLVFLAYGSLYLFRLLWLWIASPDVSRLQTDSLVEAVILVLSQVLVLAIGTGLIVIINHRLLKDLENVSEKNRLLLNELHHRVKNNLQMIISLVRLQISRQKNDEIKEPLRLVQNRIYSMAMVHEQLYIHDTGAPVDIEKYTRDVIRGLCSSYQLDSGPIKLSISATDVVLDISRLVPYGLILNELVTNALKHAYPGQDKPGPIGIKLEQQGGEYLLTVEDSGIGLPDGFNPEESRSLGMQILQSLSQQLKGELVFSSSLGARFQLSFPV